MENKYYILGIEKFRYHFQDAILIIANPVRDTENSIFARLFNRSNQSYSTIKNNETIYIMRPYSKESMEEFENIIRNRYQNKFLSIDLDGSKDEFFFHDGIRYGVKVDKKLLTNTHKIQEKATVNKEANITINNRHDNSCSKDITQPKDGTKEVVQDKNGMSYLTNEGVNWVKNKKRQGLNNNEIWDEFKKNALTNPIIYLKNGKYPIDNDIYLIAEIINLSQFLFYKDKDKWFESYPFLWICDNITRGKKKNEILQTFNKNMDDNPNVFYSYTGKHLNNNDWDEIRRRRLQIELQRTNLENLLRNEISDLLHGVTFEDSVSFEITTEDNKINMIFNG